VYFYIIEPEQPHQYKPYTVVSEFAMPCYSVPANNDILLTADAMYRVHLDNMFNSSSSTSGVFKTVNGTLVVIPIRYLVDEEPAAQSASKDLPQVIGR